LEREREKKKSCNLKQILDLEVTGFFSSTQFPNNAQEPIIIVILFLFSENKLSLTVEQDF
jgi:hypothetical protein